MRPLLYARVGQAAPTAIPAATYRVLQTQREAARAAGNAAEVARLDALLARATPLPETPSPRAVRILPRRATPQPGDIARVSYRLGTAVANDVRIVRVDPTTITGVVGAVVRADGRVDAWWSDAARMAASARLPATYPRANLLQLTRNGVRIL